MSRHKKEKVVIIPKDYTISEIKKHCKKQKGCENCRFVIKQEFSGVCIFSPIGITPADWIIGEEKENE